MMELKRMGGNVCSLFSSFLCTRREESAIIEQ
jgi:hypothetical protein